MKYQQDDGIEYFALATVGGHQGGAVPEAGMLHHFNIVTVRPEQVAHAAVPVGEMMDVREITGDMAEQATRLSRVTPTFDRSVAIGMDGFADETVTVSLTNPTEFDVDLTVIPDSRDSRWTAWPDHDHGILKAGATESFIFRLSRGEDALDATFRPIDLAVHMDMLLPGHRYTIPASRHEVPLDASLTPLPEPAYESALHLDGQDDVLVVPSAAFDVPDGPLTVEAWIRPEGFSGRTGLLAKTESSEYGIFVSDGKPEFAVHLNGSYAVAQSTEPILEVGKWQHIAGVFDGREVRLYLDGRLIEATPASGTRRPNDLPLMIGADTDRRGNPMSYFDGQIDEVRVSTAARYKGGQIRPERRVADDASAALLFRMDGAVGTWVVDSSRAGARGTMRGGARIAPAN